MYSNLPQGFTVKSPRPDEIQRVYEFVKMCEIAQDGQPDIYLADVEEKWQQPDFNLATDTVMVLNSDGHIAGYGFVRELTRPTITMVLYTGPDYYDQGISSFLLDLLEKRMSQEINQFDPTWQISFSNWTSSKNQVNRRLLEGRGYRQVREFWQMEIKLAEPPADVVWPQGITVRTLIPGQDDRATYEAYEATFGDHWGHIPISFEEYAQRRFTSKNFDPSLWFLAIDASTGAVAGYSCCSIDENFGWINNLGVKRAYRRTGLGLALLHHSFQKLYERGRPVVRLMVDGQSLTGATRLYIGAGMQLVLSFTRFEKEIRPGISLDVKKLAD